MEGPLIFLLVGSVSGDWWGDRSAACKERTVTPTWRGHFIPAEKCEELKQTSSRVKTQERCGVPWPQHFQCLQHCYLPALKKLPRFPHHMLWKLFLPDHWTRIGLRLVLALLLRLFLWQIEVHFNRRWVVEHKINLIRNSYSIDTSYVSDFQALSQFSALVWVVSRVGLFFLPYLVLTLIWQL